MVKQVKVTRNYQVTLPAEARERLGVSVGDVLVADLEGGKITFEKKAYDITTMKIRLGKKIDERDVKDAIREAGERIGSSQSR